MKTISLISKSIREDLATDEKRALRPSSVANLAQKQNIAQKYTSEHQIVFQILKWTH